MKLISNVLKLNRITGLLLIIFSFFIEGKLKAQSSEELVIFTEQSSFSKIFEVESNSQTQFIGVSAFYLSEEHNGKLFYRVNGNNNWTEWKLFYLNNEGHTEGRTAFWADPIYDRIDGIQFKSEGINHAVTFRLYKAQPTKLGVQSKKNTAICSCAQPLFCDRSCWCSSCPADVTPTPTTPTHVIIHHSAGFNTSTDFKAVMAYYWDLHVNTNGWDDIGYNWLIDPNGVVYEGRGSGIGGAHFSCMNGGTTGICLIGNFVSQKPSDTALASLEELLAWEACDKNIVIHQTGYHNSSQLNLPHLSSHRDGNNATVGCPKGTTCPGDSLYDLLGNLRDSLAAKTCLQGVSLSENGIVNILKVYPNPVEELLNFETAFKVNSVLFVNGLGQSFAVNFRSKSNQQHIISTAHLDKGVYTLVVIGDNEVSQQVFIKK